MQFSQKRKAIINSLKEILDPEIGMNIIDVGLIYNIEITSDNLVIVSMTLTTPGCPLTDYFLSEIETKLVDLDFIDDVRIDFVWSPAWHITMMNEEAKTDAFRSL